MKRTGAGPILVINAGSSSIKFAVFDGRLRELTSGLAGEIKGDSYLKTDGQKQMLDIPDHGAALTAILAALADKGVALHRLSAAAHRVVHGGTGLSQPMRITPAVLAQIQACIPLAPLHNPHNIQAIEFIANLAPDLPQYASFDTGFHATNPDVATRYAVPNGWHKSHIRRFGFHGLSYQSLVANFTQETGAPLPEKLLAFHLGNGASICAINNGQSVATTMGYSPLEGLTMGTRSGSIDAGAVLRLVKESDADSVLATLNEKSGLYALSGETSDMAALLARDSAEAKFAIEHFCYWAARHAGSMIAALGGVDAFAFTGGIGENAAPVQSRITDLLDWTGVPATAVHIVPAAEERQIAQNARDVLGDGDTG